MSGAPHVVFRIAYTRPSELRDDVAQQMARGGLLVKVHDAADLTLDTEVQLELVLPDGSSLCGTGKVLQVLTGFGVAVSVDADLVERSRRAASGGDDAPGSGPSRHERVDARPPSVARRAPPGTRPPPVVTAARRAAPAVAPAAPPAAVSAAAEPSAAPDPRTAGPNRLEKIQLALHGTRDERNAILRDRDRTLYPFVLKNPQLDADDVLAIAKNAQMTGDMLTLIGGRKEWLGRPAIALALARNPKTPPDLAVRALDHVALDALRHLARGGVLPHVTQAARKKLLS